MQPFRHHVFACEQRKPDGAPCCSARGSLSVIDALRREVATQGLVDAVQVTACGSLGLCEWGPNLVVHPEGTWYSGVSAADVPEIVREHLLGGRPVARLAQGDEVRVRAEITTNRNRYQAAMKAKDAAGQLPDDLQQRLQGFRESRIVLSAVELDLFTAVGEGATAAAVADARGTQARATGLLLDALVALGLLAKQDGRYANTPVSARFLVAGGRDDARAAIGHTISLWSSWSTLTDAVRAGHSVLPPDAHDSPDWTVPFIAAMHRNAALRAPLLVQAVGPGVTRMLDVGGGSGACAIAFAQANPDLQVDLLDVPEVLPIARGHIERAGLERRIQLCAGDLTSDLLGQGYDLVLLSAICHMLSEAENLDLLRRARAALVPGGRLLVQDFILEPGGTAPVHAALFSINMLVGTQAGRCYDEATYSSWMEQAGLGEVRRVRLPGPSDLMIATRG